MRPASAPNVTVAEANTSAGLVVVVDRTSDPPAFSGSASADQQPELYTNSIITCSSFTYNIWCDANLFGPMWNFVKD